MPIQVALSRSPVIALFVIGLVVIVGSLAYVYLPSATITVSPATEQKSVEQTIVLSTDATSPDFIKYVLPAKLVSKDVTQSKDFQREGTTIEDFAHGTITMVNNGNDEQRLVPKTHLRHEASGVMFLTQDRVVIPPQGKITVDIIAEQKGASGNVPAGKFIVDRLPSSAQAIVFGQSDVPMSGGLSVAAPVTDKEIDDAVQSVLDDAKKEALTELTGETGGVSIRPELITATTKSKSVSTTSGSTVSSFTVSETVSARGFIVDDNDLLSLTLLALRSAATDTLDFTSYDPQSFKIAVTRADFSKNVAEIKGSLTGTFADKISPSVLATQNLAGLSAAEVADHFKQISGVGDVKVAFSPFWVTTVPSRADAVKVEIKNPETK
jgi:hypothetical protein